MRCSLIFLAVLRCSDPPPPPHVPLNDNCRSHSENLKIPIQNPFTRRLIDSKVKEFQKSEIGLQKDQTHHLIVCAMLVHAKIRLHNFISSSLQKEKQAIDVPNDSSRCKRLLPTTVSSPDRCPVLFACRRSAF